MSLKTGDKLGPCEILAPIGAGGMGEVWKTRDTRLNRVVAIKRLKRQHTGRFEQEARAIAALNHPNICTPQRGWTHSKAWGLVRCPI